MTGMTAVRGSWSGLGRPDFFSSRLDVKQEFLRGIGNLGVFVLIFLSVAGEAGKKGEGFLVVG